MISLIEVLVWISVLSLFIFGIDDLIIDLVKIILKAGPQKISEEEATMMNVLEPSRIAIVMANWKEDGVLEKMVSGNISQIKYNNYQFVLGVYPNDFETLAEARRLEMAYPQVRVVVNELPGPTSKGQMLNQIVQAIVEENFDLLLIHDSEDIIHPESLKLINLLSLKKDVIQVPVFSLPVRNTSFVAGTYIDEFGEHHTKEMCVRNHLNAAIPSAGVGTALRMSVVKALLALQNGQLLKEDTLTEDYHLGMICRRLGLTQQFACYFFENSNQEKDFIATREFFPKTLQASIRQRTRWTLGIFFQGVQNLGWGGSILDKYFLWRDRKTFLSSIVLLFSSSLLLLLLLDRIGHFGWDSILQNQFLSFMLLINFALMVWRVFSRVFCVWNVYRAPIALMGLVRWPLTIYIQIVTTFRAWSQYTSSQKQGVALVWSKTQHELPENFGLSLSQTLTQTMNFVDAEPSVAPVVPLTSSQNKGTTDL